MLLYYSISVHERKDAFLVLVQVCGFYLCKERTEVLSLERDDLVCLCVDLDLKLVEE